jgi:A/G-specific adenine glycosylase
MPPKSTPGVTLGKSPQVRQFRRRLIAWFRRHGRDLPWRRTRDPYHVVVSEFMLQQTQVSRVEQYYRRFLLQYPTIRDLAVAAPAQVRESWEGLGYYRRAVNLHRLAVTVVEERDGVMPATVAELERLPGVGRYTAGAVASFAFERSEPAVDTNVARVIRRVFFSPRSRTTDRRVWELARTLVPRRGRPAWSFNQAIMELGAVVCTARVARCSQCPVSSVCRQGSRTAQRRDAEAQRKAIR